MAHDDWEGRGEGGGFNIPGPGGEVVALVPPPYTTHMALGGRVGDTMDSWGEWEKSEKISGR